MEYGITNSGLAQNSLLAFQHGFWSNAQLAKVLEFSSTGNHRLTALFLNP
ncbi:MAG: hypothetical protein OXD01_15910 [Gammaproteobacteria bacterium]|nr:hypothetical protein [Gammaproteobacteria bacterium]